MNNEDFYRQAQRKVKAKKGFYYHLIAYVGVISMLYTIMFFEGGGEFLPVVIVGLSWGIGLASHYFNVFGTEHLEFMGANPDWEEDELEKELERLQHKRKLKEQILEEKELLEDLDRLELKEMESRTMDRDF